MAAHKHAEMIKAKADNMDLVVFGNAIGGEWRECTFADLTIATGFYEFFLCLAQHKEVCLHWLNGGDVLVKSKFVPSWEVVLHGQVWGDTIGWMREDAKYRIKPRKEKRWIAACNGGYNCIDKLFDNKNQAKEFVTAFYPNNRVGDFQFIEIEVEV